MPQDSVAEPGVERPVITPLDIVRVIVLVAAIASLAIWGFAAWPLPLGAVFGIGAPLVLLLVWALFLSPRPVLRLHPFLRAAVELLVYAGVTVAWWSMGEWLIGTVFAVVAVATGLIAGRRSLT